MHGKFKLAQQQLSEKALHCLCKIRKNLDFYMQTPAENSYKKFPIDNHPNSTIQLRSLGCI